MPAQSALFSLSLYTSGSPGSVLDTHSIGTGGGSQRHNDIMPYLGLNFCTALVGIFPSPD